MASPLAGLVGRFRMVTAEDVRRVAPSLPRTEEALVRDRVKFRIGRIVYASLSRDETIMGFAFPKKERAALVSSEPDKFLMPTPSEERHNWVLVRLGALDQIEMRELIIDAWCMVVPKRVSRAHLGPSRPDAPARGRGRCRP